MADRIGVGDRAPDFDLPDQHGRDVRLYALLERGPVVLYFYPKDETAGCTAEACAFRDDHEDFVDAGATVVGVSGDGVDSHRAFAERLGLPFLLVSDAGDAVRRTYGVPRTLGLLAGRVTYVIDGAGRVRHVFNSQLRATRHVDEALETVRRLAREAEGARAGGAQASDGAVSTGPGSPPAPG